MADGPVSLLQTTHHMFLVLNVNLESHQLTAASAEGKLYFLSSDLLLFRLLSFHPVVRHLGMYAQLTSR